MTPRWLLAAAGLAVVVGCTQTATPAAPTPAPTTTTAPTTTEPSTPPVTVINTGGALNPAVTPATLTTTICRSGWTATIRPPTTYTNPIKLALIAALPPDADHRPGDYELDHKVPLEVGGAPRDRANLALQPWNGATGAHAKDAVEDRVHREVCAGTITLTAGQTCFEIDWRTCP